MSHAVLALVLLLIILNFSGLTVTMSWYYYDAPATPYSFATNGQGIYDTHTQAESYCPTYDGNASGASGYGINNSAAPNQQEEPKRITYTLKILNPIKKSKFSICKIRRQEIFCTPDELRQCIRSECGDSVSETDFDMGYYKGQRGSAKVWIKDGEDIRCMYDQLSGTKATLRCEGQIDPDQECDSLGKKRKSSLGGRPISKRQAIREEVDEIFANLQEKHGSRYSAAQLRLWADMVQVGTHRDSDNPPNVPMFGA